jgi:hypothetical protein
MMAMESAGQSTSVRLTGMFEVLVVALLPALPGISLSLLALMFLMQAKRAPEISATLFRSDYPFVVRWRRALFSLLFGVPACAAGMFIEFVIAFAYFDTAEGHMCSFKGSAAYCQSGDVFPALFLVLLIFGALDVLLLPTLMLWRWRRRHTG